MMSKTIRRCSENGLARVAMLSKYHTVFVNGWVTLSIIGPKWYLKSFSTVFRESFEEFVALSLRCDILNMDSFLERRCKIFNTVVCNKWMIFESIEIDWQKIVQVSWWGFYSKVSQLHNRVKLGENTKSCSVDNCLHRGFLCCSFSSLTLSLWKMESKTCKSCGNYVC